MNEIRNPKESRRAKSERVGAVRDFLSAFGIRISFDFRLSNFGIAGIVSACFLNPLLSQAAVVYETPAEFLTSGDFNGDGRIDALVLDKQTGNARVGYQDSDGALTWSSPISTGADPAIALAVGRFAQTNSDAIAVTGSGLNRLHILNLSSSSNSPVVLNPPHADITTLVGLEAPYGTVGERSWLAAGAHDPGITLLDLLAFVADSLSSFQDQIAAEGYLDTASSFSRFAGDATLLAAMRRGSNDTFVVYEYTNTAAPVLVRPNLPAGSLYVFGRFNNEPYPRVLFYVPGESNVIVQPLIQNGATFEFGEATVNTLTSAVQRVYYVEEETNGLAVVQFGNGVVGLRPPAGGDGQLVVSYGLGLGPTGNVITGVTPLGIGRFALLSSKSNLLSSTDCQIFTQIGGNYVQTSSNSLPSVTSAETRGNVWLFQIEPFISSAASMIASLSAPSWSSTVSGLPGSLSVRVESDGGVVQGLGSPNTNSFGSPPAGTAYVLPNQYRDDISFFGYGPVRAPEPSVITISPPPGSYGGPIFISFTSESGIDDVYYRASAEDSWQLYFSPFLLTNDATIDFYGSSPVSERSRTQSASYVLGNIPVPPEPLVTLPGSDTNPPPPFNTNVPIISANGTVFYSRHSALADLDSFLGPSPYLSFSDSPFNAAGFAYFYLENFEDGAFNVPGAAPSPGWIVTTGGGGADSVDTGGQSYYSGGSQTSLTITFNAAALGGKLPTHAGIVWTDVGFVTSGLFGFGDVNFTARDANGALLGPVLGMNLGNGSPVPSQAEDRFFGIVHAGGISSITIAMPNSVDWEVDHLQYGYLDAAGFNDGIWAINLDGSGETFITDGARPRVSRDGKLMAFLRGGDGATVRGNLWVRELATGQEQLAFTNTDVITGFDWNRTEPELVFDNNCVLLRTEIGGVATQLPSALTPECLNGAPVVNPVDGRLGFHNLNPSVASGVYVTPPDWSSRTKIPEPTTLRLRWPSWSPDGSHLAMADQTSSAFLNTGVNLWTALADGSNLRQITALTEPDGFPRGAIWTADGRALIGAGSIHGTNGLWMIPLAADGSSCHCPPRLLPTSAGSEIDFAGSVIGGAPVGGISYVKLGLFIRLEPAMVVVYWNTNYDGFTLERAVQLPAGTFWTPVIGPYFRAGPYFEYREPRAVLQPLQYFRLRYPGVLVITPDEPELTFGLNGGQAVLNWPLSYVGYSLETATNLSPPIEWKMVQGPYSITNGMFEFETNLIAPSFPERYFRLRWP